MQKKTVAVAQANGAATHSNFVQDCGRHGRVFFLKEQEMIYALISGTLWRSPEQRTAKTGRPFVTTTIKIRDGDASQFVNTTAFSESVQAELLRLADGDALSVQGRFRAEIYAGADGSNRISLSLVAEQILPLRQPPKTRAAKAPAPPKEERQRGFWTGPDDGPNDNLDDLPF
jgi:single-stranded DNA-binding protein